MKSADLSAAAIVAHFTANGGVPALLDGACAATVLPVIEGLVYPWFAGCRELFAKNSRYSEFLGVLKHHIVRALESGACIAADNSWKLSSSSDMTWLSKLYMCRFIATEILGISENELFTKADKAHAAWLFDETNSCFAWSDQFRNGKVAGSRYYPRGVTACLWLDEQLPVR
jgi:hypothetical protein